MKIRKYVAVFDYGEFKKGTYVDAIPRHAPVNTFVPVDVEVQEKVQDEPLKHTPDGVND